MQRPFKTGGHYSAHPHLGNPLSVYIIGLLFTNEKNHGQNRFFAVLAACQSDGGTLWLRESTEIRTGHHYSDPCRQHTDTPFSIRYTLYAVGSRNRCQPRSAGYCPSQL